MKKLLLLFLATAAMTLVSCGGSSSEGTSASSASTDSSIEMDAVADSMPAVVEQAIDSVVPKGATEQVAEEPATPEPTTCPKCDGSGKVTCSKCGGKGYTSKTTLADEGYWTQYYGCKRCGGRGYKTSEGYDGEYMREGTGEMNCPKCHGTGLIGV